MKKLTQLVFIICSTFLMMPVYAEENDGSTLFDWLINPVHAASTYQSNNNATLQKVLLKQFTLKHNPNDYLIEFSPNSKLKDVPLQNTSFKAQVWYYGNPKGIIILATDENQQFTMEEYKDSNFLAIEILSINNEDKYHARCTGEASPQHNTIQITCNPSKA